MSQHQSSQNSPIQQADIQQQITNSIIEILEKGTIPWKKPFVSDTTQFLGLPINFTTGVNYNGINILLLWINAIDKQFPTNEWATLKQWNKLNESIRPQQKGTMIVKYDILEKEKDGEIERIPYIKKSYVFNRSQLKSYVPVVEDYPVTDNVVEKIETIEEFVSKAKVKIQHGGFQAFYNRSDDVITMPPTEHFIDTDYCTAGENYYSTMFHELGHWTGHESRLKRLNDKFTKGNYAKEELVAELTASFLNAKFEIAGNELPNSAAYIASWLKELKNDKNMIISAASAASKAVRYLETLDC